MVEEGFDAVLAASARDAAVARIFDGEREATLIAWPVPKGRQGTRPLDIAVVGEKGGMVRNRHWRSCSDSTTIGARSKKHL